VTFAAHAGAAPTVAVSTDYYEVGGTTPSDIRSELDRKRPRGWDGYTTWNISWQFRYAPAAGDCGMTEVATHVAVNYKLPRWRVPAGASRDTRDQWARYERALRAHEDGHRDIGVVAANEIDNTLRGMRAADCRGLEAQANETARRLLDNAREREREYDRTTGNGATQGARFP
jgi:predicted secreted Zn-dependent protease